MKIEFNMKEVDAMLRSHLIEQFPDYEITHLHSTTYDHLIVTLERKPPLEEVVLVPPPYLDTNEE